MHTRLLLATVCYLLSVSALLSGCKSESAENDSGEAVSSGHDHKHDHGHSHSSKGPHGGDVVELGNEEYHAELIHDEQSGEVTIYILDGAVKESVAIAASEITINLKHGDEPEQFKLVASPDEGDAEGKSSRFVSTGGELGEELHEHHDDATLVVTIGGKQYRQTIEHDHDDGHDGHEHGDGQEGHEHGDKEHGDGAQHD